MQSWLTMPTLSQPALWILLAHVALTGVFALIAIYRCMVLQDRVVCLKARADMARWSARYWRKTSERTWRVAVKASKTKPVAHEG